MLLLFDIDGTLVRTAGAGRHALNSAFLELHGWVGALDSVRLDGNTDPQILGEVFQTHMRRLPSDEEAQAIRDRYLEHLEPALQERLDAYQVLPGVRRILEWTQGRVPMGLATGNIEAGARMKLRPGDLDRFFPFGGFGSDGAERALLVKRAIERGSAHAGRRFDPSEVVIFGDTERDVEAARTVGARSVGVLAGASDVERLRSSEPDLLVESFDDPELRTWLAS